MCAGYRCESSKTLDFVTNEVHTTSTDAPALDLKRILTIVPARYGSTRFPGKPLAQIQGLPMVQQVVERIKESALNASHFLVATDDLRIEEALQSFQTPTVMTRADHPSGSDRLWEAYEYFIANQKASQEIDWIINIQGDEPFISPQDLNILLHTMQRLDHQADIVTLITPYFDSHTPQTLEEAQALLNNPNRVKALYTASEKVLYFSRLPIPYSRNSLELDRHCQDDSDVYYRHIGVYAYKVEALKRFVSSPPSRLEQLEQLEQLRALEMGMSIYAGIIPQAPIGVDTPEDLQQLIL
jgi:3-deoxy-manno-octulosonate cytidylyltransferase (CMP-KDO synthetase)